MAITKKGWTSGVVIVVIAAFLAVESPSTAVAQQPGRGTYTTKPRSSGNRAARHGSVPIVGGSTQRPGAVGSQTAPRGAPRPTTGSLVPKSPQIGGAGGGSRSRLPAGVQLPQMPGTGNFIQPRR